MTILERWMKNRETLRAARKIDPAACFAPGSTDVLHVGTEYAKDVCSIFPGSECEDAAPGSSDFKRIVLRPAALRLILRVDTSAWAKGYRAGYSDGLGARADAEADDEL